MKNIILILFILGLSQLAYSQPSGLYVVREKFTTGNGLYDSLLVTDPTGVTTGYNLNPFNRGQVIGQVLNSIIALGYRIIPVCDFNLNYETVLNTYDVIWRENVMFLSAP